MTAAPDQPADDGATVPRGPRSGNALPDGARLAEFEVRGVIGEGGFGIVYLAWDASLQRRVAIKEYMPATLAARTHGSRVLPRTDKSTETFALGLRSFVNEAQLLASFDHPSLLKVYRFWEANGTAYMVMPYYQGITLKKALNALDAPPEEGWLLRQLGPLLDALGVMHRGRCYHRDIAPDNILLLDDGTPLLLDFGAARRVIGDATHALTAFLKPGYAPVEQYAEMPTMKQGPWTDLYALGSVVHYAITGRTPPESVARLVNDTMVPLAVVAKGRYSERFLRAIDHALAVRPEDRPQSASELRDALGIEERRARTGKTDRIPTAPQALDETVLVRDAPQVSLRQAAPAVPPSMRGSAAPAALPPQSAPRRSRLAAPPPAPPAPPARAAAPGHRVARAWLLLAGLALAGALALAWWSLPSPGTAPAVEAPPRAETPAQPPAAAVRDAGAAPADAPPAAATTVPAPAIKPNTPSAPDTPAAAASAAQPMVVDEAPAARRPPAHVARPTPRKNSPNPRCTEIITRASLGEQLSAQDEAMLKGECRK
ncbi:MAG TPA: serine/threonine-protein kinase [Burkholderiaceae bacterium]|nr:serine/threonine-protein kinase [Burkholderiaceae bacterium]